MFVLTRLPGKDTDLSRSIQSVILGIASAWGDELRRNPVASLYSGRIRFQPEPRENKVEEWVDPPTVAFRGYGDCDDLVIYRLAEIYAKANWRLGDNKPMPAWPLVFRKTDGSNSYHVAVRFADGKEEDPSVILLQKAGKR